MGVDVSQPGRIRRAFGAALAVAIAVGLLVALPPLLAGAAPSLPQGFVLQDVPSGLRPEDPITDFGYLPDESLLVIAKNGKVVWTPQTGAARELARLSVNDGGDMGLISLAIAPDYAASHTVYTTRTMPLGTPGAGAYGALRLSRWTVAVDSSGNPTGLTDEFALVNTTSDGDSHGMWDVVAAPDGTVFVSIGDSADWRVVDPVAVRALDVNDVHGKLLHLRPDGSGVPGNPYYDASAPRAVRSLVYASGLRSPFRFILEPDSGRLILGDVGWNNWEEVNLINPGNNYGWPCWEGDERTPGYRDLPECAARSTASPLWTYRHNGGGAVAGGVVYTGAAYPPEYRGRYFFGDYVFHKIFTLRMNERGELVTPPEPDGFGREIGLPVRFATVPTGGDIVYADIGSAKIHRLVYAPGNNPPQAAVTSTVNPDTRMVTFDAGGSFDPNGDPLTYRWDFGDGTPPANGPSTIDHTYPTGPDHFTATVTVTDPLAATGSAATTVYPSNHAPTLNLSPPRQDVTFAVGDAVTATATATDAEDGPRPVSWAVTLVHCIGIGICHIHPGEQQTGPNFRLVFNGHPGDSRLEVTASATDSRGAVSKETFVVRPKQRRVSVQSNTPAVFTIGEEQATTGLFTVGMNLSIVAPASARDGVASFDSWGDGGTNRIRQLTVPDADQTLPISYSTPIDRRYATDAALRSIVGTPVNVEQGDATVRFREYTAGRVYWSPDTGVHFVIGAILGTYLDLDGHLGYGLPTTDETPTPDGIGAYNHFQNGSIYWTPSLGAHEARGPIRDRWAALGWERSVLGYPATNQIASTDGIGAYNHFQGGSIFWSPASGAHEVHGAIRNRWADLGWEHSSLGYPTSDEYAIPVGARSDFQHGSIIWNAADGRVTIVNTVTATW
jgi:glucose/arabinose dehydrogenase